MANAKSTANSWERDEHERHEGHGRHFENGVIIAPGYQFYPYGPYEEPPEYDETSPDYLLYCENPPGYYPNVPDCPSGWKEVPPDEEDAQL